MPKNIVVCADGTWKGPGKDQDADGVADDLGELSNVVKLYSCLKGQVTPETVNLPREQEKRLVDPNGNELQLAKYVNGVGDTSNRLLRLITGASGAGVIGRIVRGYSFISRCYDPGDRIYLVGFSRGAYTVRALAGLIASVGLLNRNTVDMRNEKLRYELGVGAWVLYRQRARKIDNALVSAGLSLVVRRPEPHELHTEVPIRAIGVWDTVGAYGIPAYAYDKQRIDLFRFADCKLSPRVQQGFHAVAIDEQRADFTPTLWEPAPNVTQVWFAGAHGDVGGGAPRAGLSDIALVWMMESLAKAGVLFDAPPVYAAKHDISLASQTPWVNPPFNVALRKHRAVPEGAWIHGSVVKRGRYNRDALGALIKGEALDPGRCKVVEWAG